MGNMEIQTSKEKLHSISALQCYAGSGKDPYVQCSIIGLDVAKIDATGGIRHALNEPDSTLTFATRLNRDLLPERPRTPG